MVYLLGCDIGGAKEPGVIYFPINWGAKEPQNLPNHRVVWIFVFGIRTYKYLGNSAWAFGRHIVLYARYDPGLHFLYTHKYMP